MSRRRLRFAVVGLGHFAQEYIPLEAAVAASVAVAMAIIGLRAATLLGFWRALAGVVLPGAAIMSLTLVAAIWTTLQGILLTALALGFFIAAMTLMPRVNAASASFWLRRPEEKRPSTPGSSRSRAG